MDKKALLVITDGEDNTSKYGLNAVMKRLSESKNVTVYVIGLLELNDTRGGLFRRSPSSRAKRDLRELAESTGGQAFFPESLDEVEELCRRIAYDLRNHYTIGYNPPTRTLTGPGVKSKSGQPPCRLPPGECTHEAGLLRTARECGFGESIETV